ncbi:MAG TPA: erythromycin esterase family protein [Chryseolinea sp.]|nr:erythromycin esterase family protein [Chryseolinea sp.]
MKNSLIILFLFAISNLQLSAQEFLNLDFEHHVYKGQPRKWVIEGEGQYHGWVDSLGNPYSGKKSLAIRLKNGEAYVFLALPANIIKGKAIKVTGFVKANQFDSLQIMLGFKDPQGRPKLVPLQDPVTNQWNKLENQTSIAAEYNSDKLLIALIVIGSGNINFDGVSIEINGTAIGDKGAHFPGPTEDEINTLNRSLIPIKDLNANSRLDDLKALNKAVGNPKVIALGENSHGSSSIYKLKLRLVQYLVQEKGYSMFALESPSIEADVINKYVTTKEVGTIENILSNLVYPSWRTQDMIDIIEWIKHHNQTAKNKVQFRGFDMQDKTAALNRLLVIANEHDNELVLKLDSITSELKREQPDLAKAYNLAESLQKYADGLNANATPTYSKELILEVKRCALILKQNLGLSLHLKSRDEYMAENIQWLLSNYCSNGHLIVSADNSHITRATGKMGQFLKSANGTEYLNIGFTFNTGSYAAYGDKKYYEVHPSYVGTYEYLFSKAKVDNFILDLRQPSIKVIVSSSKGFRSIGSRPQETTQFSETMLSDNYDLIAYLEISTHTEMK